MWVYVYIYMGGRWEVMEEEGFSGGIQRPVLLINRVCMPVWLTICIITSRMLSIVGRA